MILALAIVMAGTSCVKEKLETTYNNQENRIDQYINQNRYVTVDGKQDTLKVVYNGGSNRLIKTEGTGEELNTQGTIAFYYAGYTFNGSKSKSNLFMTNHQETALDAGWNLTEENFKVYMTNMNGSDLLEGLKNGLLGVKTGEHCEILFSGKYGFGNKEFGIIPANSALLYEIWVEAVSND